MFSEVKKIFGDWKQSDFDIFATYPIPEFKPLTESVFYLTENANARTPIMMVGMHGPDTRNDVPATYAADVFSYILAQESSKFHKELVDDGLAFQVQASYQTCKYVGPIQFILVPNPERIKQAYNKLLEHMKQWDSDDYYTDEQLETAKQLLAIEQTRAKESTSAYVHNVTFWWASASIDYYTSYIENLRKVTREDIKKFVKSYIKDKPMITGLLVSPEMKSKMGITDAASFLR
jgi:zinc protease